MIEGTTILRGEMKRNVLLQTIWFNRSKGMNRANSHFGFFACYCHWNHRIIFRNRMLTFLLSSMNTLTVALPIN